MSYVLDFSKFGSEKELHSAAAKAMDSIRNGSEYEGVVLSDVMMSEEIRTFTDYVGKLVNGKKCVPCIIEESCI